MIELHNTGPLYNTNIYLLNQHVIHFTGYDNNCLVLKNDSEP